MLSEKHRRCSPKRSITNPFNASRPALASTIFYFLLLVATTPGSSNSPSQDPLLGATMIDIEMVVGGPLWHQPSLIVQLFDGSPERASAFVHRAKQALTLRLLARGIEVREDEKVATKAVAGGHALGVHFFGRPLETKNCTEQYVFLVRAAIARESPAENDAPPIWENIWERQALGVAREGELENVLLEYLTSMLVEILPSTQD